MAQQEKIKYRLSGNSDNLRANSKCAGIECFISVMRFAFLRNAYNRYLAVKFEFEDAVPSPGGVDGLLTKEEFSKKAPLIFPQLIIGEIYENNPVVIK